MFTVHGQLIDRLELSARAGEEEARMGGTLWRRPGAPVTLSLRIGLPTHANHAGRRPRLAHVDVIVGGIAGRSPDPAAMTNPTARIAHRLTGQDWRPLAPGVIGIELILREAGEFYVRVRGTNRADLLPAADLPGQNPWDDLWFYSNPIFVRER